MAANKGVEWTDEALRVLRQHYPGEGYKGVQSRIPMKKSKQAIVQKARRLGLSSNAPRPGHGMVGTRTWNAWRAAKERCTNPNHQHYAMYGGRGIALCDRWQSFEAFLSDMGPAPTEQHQIDRIDPKKGYEPKNCRWVTAQQNAANARSKNKTGYRGVYPLPSGRFRALLRCAGVRKDLGVFGTAESAAKAYDKAAIEAFGIYAMTNERMRDIQQ